MPSIKTMTAREVRETVPDPATLNVVPIPGKLRRELFRAMQMHARIEFKTYCHAFEVSAGNLTRDLYFQIAHAIDFPINAWLEKECGALEQERRTRREAQTSPARVAKGKLAVAVAKLESLGFAWYGPANDFIAIKPAVPTDWD